MELPHVGKQCSIATCNALDFLPFNCPFCHGIFCGSHGLPKDHDCSEMERANKQVARCDKCGNMIKVPDTESWTLDETVTHHIEAGCKKYVFVSSSSTSSIKQQDRACAFEGCRELQQKKTLTPVRCTGCQKNYCLKHRHAVDHGCSSLKTSEQIKEDRRRMAIEKLNKTFHSSNQQPKTSTTRKAIATKKSGGMVEWMKMKSKAKGPSSIPLASRLYLYVEFPKESRMEEQPMFFDKNYRVGKVLDMIVDTCRVQNNNNRLPNNDPQLLGLYKQPTLDSLDPAARLNDVLANMDTVYLERLGVIADL